VKKRRKSSSKSPAVIAGILIIVISIGFYQAVVAAKAEKNVVTAKTDLPAYSFVSDADLEFTPVPKGSITENDITEDEYHELYGENGLVLTERVLAGQRIDKREVAEGPQESFSVVLPDERVVAATTTLEGAAVGTIQAGDVVDVSSEGGDMSGGGLVEFAKVICIANTPSGCAGVLPPGVDLSASGSGENVIVLLAVPRDSAEAVSGRQVSMALNPFCRVDRSGYFVATREGAEPECKAPGRMASDGITGESASESASVTDGEE